MIKNIITIIGLLLTSFFVSLETTHSQRFNTDHYEVVLETVCSKLEYPWSFGFLPDGRMLITERSGKLKIVSETGEPQLVAGVPLVWAVGQGGLLDVKVSPHFNKDHIIFLTYSQPSKDGQRAGTALAMGYLNFAERPILRGVRVLFSQKNKTSDPRHFGSRIVIAPDGKLFFSIGDRGDAQRAQNAFDYAGSIIRLNFDGSIPKNNPFVSNTHANPEIWSLGHRNIQGATWNHFNNTLWTVEHGPRGGDEINIPHAGKNYGWPIISYGKHYSGAKVGEGTHKAGYEQPLYYWDPSIAPSGLLHYRGKAFPAWRKNLFVGALKSQFLGRLELKNGRVIAEERLFVNEFGRIRDVREGPNGHIYFLTDGTDGKLIRISPK